MNAGADRLGQRGQLFEANAPMQRDAALEGNCHMLNQPARLHGVDVSHHQTSVDWDKIAKTSQFAFVRATYGRTRDHLTVQHCARARAAGLAVGLYAFFRPSEPVLDQFDAICAQADAAGYGVGDIIPALDVELDPVPKSQPVSPDWQAAVRELTTSLARSFGDCLVYITQRDFGLLGKPAWLLERPLWVAHWGVGSPATPAGRPWAIWQYAVGHYAPGIPAVHPEVVGAIDHNYAIAPLPLIKAPSVKPPDPADPSVVAARQLPLDEGISGRAAENIHEDEAIPDTEPGSPRGKGLA